MKRNRKWLSIAAFFVLAFPMIFTVNAGAYVSDGLCLMCHEPTSHPDEGADKTAYLLGGHANASREYTGPTLLGAGGGPLEHDSDFVWGSSEILQDSTYPVDPDGFGGPLPEAPEPLVLVHHSWFPDNAGEGAGDGETVTCLPCHTTGFDPDGGGAYPAALTNGSITVAAGSSPIDDGMASGVGTWELFGVQCEKCHNEQIATTAADDGGTAGASALKFNIYTEGTDVDSDGDKCDDEGGGPGTRVANYMYSDDYKSTADFAGATFTDKDGGALLPLVNPCFTYPQPVITHWPPGPPDPVETFAEGDYIETTVLCGECHLQSHRNTGFLNSAHADYSGPEGDLAEYADSDNWGADNTFAGPGGNYGSCDACHNVHETVFNDDINSGEGFFARCGIECHNPQSPDSSGGYEGFHDGFGGLAPDTTSAAGNCSDGTNTTEGTCTGYWNPAGTKGNNPEACKTCHMHGAQHFFGNSVDPDYDPVAEGVAKVTLGITYGISGTGQAFNHLDDICGQCHYDGGVAVNKFTVEELAVFATDYHQHEGAPPAGEGSTATYARFNWYQGAGCYQVNFDGNDNDSTCSWDFNGEGSSIDCVTSFTFSSAGTKQVTLTTGGGTRTMAVTAKAVNALPDTGMTVAANTAYLASGMNLLVTDASSANACDASTALTAVVVWGDGTTTLAVISEGGAVGSHTYSVPGTYTISYSTRDSAGNKAFSAPQTWTVPDTATSVCAVEGDITNTAILTGTKVTLKEGMTVVKMGQTDTLGHYSIPNVQAGRTYDIIPSRNGYEFTPDTISLTLDCTGTPNNTGNDFVANGIW